MKKTQIVIAASILLALSANVSAQTWGSSTAPTYTTGMVGIGNTASVPTTDAYLHIYGQPTSSTCTTWSGSVISATYFPNPELWIDRQVPSSGMMPPCSLSSNNYFQISNSGMMMGSSGGWSWGTAILDVFDQNGWLGVNQAHPTRALDVNGDGLIERDLYVDGKVVIGHSIISPLNAPGTYGLYVGKGILASKVKVALTSTSYWSDYVFNKGYKSLLSDKNNEGVAEAAPFS